MNRLTIRGLLLGAMLSVALSFANAETQSADPKSRLAIAEAIFADRCKKSGEFIHRTVENVEGVFLTKIRTTSNFSDQFRMDDPYGHDSTWDEYLKSFMYGRRASGSLTSKPDEAKTQGFSYVEAIDSADGKRYRYTGRIDQPWLRDKRYGEWVRKFVLDKALAPGPAPRYGVTYDDISTYQEREYWIAGSSLKVIDLKTQEVIAERVGYMMDRGQGNTSGGRSPWLLAASNACPRFPLDGSKQSNQGNQTRNFVEKAIKPIQGKQ